MVKKEYQREYLRREDLEENLSDSCHVSNLEWATNAENAQHAHDNGLVNNPLGEDCHLSKLKNTDAVYIRDNPDKHLAYYSR